MAIQRDNKTGTCSTGQGPVAASVDLRDMVRRHLMAQALAFMEESQRRRNSAVKHGQIEPYQDTIRQAVRRIIGVLPAGKNAPHPVATKVSTFDKPGYRLENVLFESFPGWQVNATVYVPLDFGPPFPGVVMPVGHCSKESADCQLPAQFLARCGYLTVVFDPPGFGERIEGNDHFIDGVRCYLVGQTSSRYFVCDALRCIDYLETRDDVDLNQGVAMTGVSGGGTTTIIASLLDDRISVVGPSCCLTALTDLDISQCYAGCPETHMPGRYAQGIDEIDLLCGAAPKPALLMAGRHDEVFRVEDTTKLARQTESFYAAINAEDKFRFFVDEVGHKYSLAQAKEFVEFLNTWLLDVPEGTMPELPDHAFCIDPAEQLKCRPRSEANMQSLPLNKADELAKSPRPTIDCIRNAALKIAQLAQPVTAAKATASKTFRVWTHHWQEILLEPENGIELPATFVSSLEGAPATILHLDNQHRNRLLEQHGVMAQTINFLNEPATPLNLLSVDLRGWGDTAVAMYPYEMAAWGSVDKYLSYTSAALGDPIMAQRIRDALAALAYLRTHSKVDNENIVITACGLAGIIALHVAIIDGGIKHTVIWDTLVSFKSLLDAESYVWTADAFVPNILVDYDLADLVAALDQSVSVLNPLDAAARPVSPKHIKNLNEHAGKDIYRNDVTGDSLAEHIQSILKP